MRTSRDGGGDVRGTRRCSPAIFKHASWHIINVCGANTRRSHGCFLRLRPLQPPGDPLRILNPCATRWGWLHVWMTSNQSIKYAWWAHRVRIIGCIMKYGKNFTLLNVHAHALEEAEKNRLQPKQVENANIEKKNRFYNNNKKLRYIMHAYKKKEWEATVDCTRANRA